MAQGRSAQMQGAAVGEPRERTWGDHFHGWAVAAVGSAGGFERRFNRHRQGPSLLDRCSLHLLGAGRDRSRGATSTNGRCRDRGWRGRLAGWVGQKRIERWVPLARSERSRAFSTSFTRPSRTAVHRGLAAGPPRRRTLLGFPRGRFPGRSPALGRDAGEQSHRALPSPAIGPRWRIEKPRAATGVRSLECLLGFQLGSRCSFVTQADPVATGLPVAIAPTLSIAVPAATLDAGPAHGALRRRILRGRLPGSQSLSWP